MANHPARPAHPFHDPREMRDELTDLDNLTADLFGPNVPLRDRVATLVADWQDTTTALVGVFPESQIVADVQADRRGLT